MLNNYTLVKLMEPYFVKQEEFRDAFIAAAEGDITDVIAGLGLTGGGISGSVTLNVGAGDGLVVTADAVTIDLATDPGLEFDTGDLKILLPTDSGLTLAASGLAMGTPGTSEVVSTNLISASGHTHEVDDSSNPGITTTGKILSSTAAGHLQLERLITPDLYSDVNITFDPASDYILPLTNYDVNLGMLSKKYLTLHAAELWVETLVAQETIATIGGRILVGPTTKLTSDWVDNDLMVSNNPSFETAGGGGVDVFASWNEVAGSGTIARDSTYARYGTYSCKLTNTAGNAYVYSLALPVTGNRQYVVSFWTRGDGTYAGRYAIYDTTNSSYITPGSAESTGVTEATWTHVTFFFNTRSNTANVRIYLHSPSATGGTTWFDMVSIGISEHTITVEHNQMTRGDIAYLEADGKVEFIGIATEYSGSGPYTYTVARNLDGTGANDWYAGDAVFNLEAPDSTAAYGGFLDIYSYAGVWSGTVGPAIVGNVWPSLNSNLVGNPSFETGSDNPPVFDFDGGWTETIRDGSDIDRDSTYVQWGTNACKMSWDGVGLSPYVTQLITVSPNTMYRFNCRTRGDGTAGIKWYIQNTTADPDTYYQYYPTWGFNTVASYEKYAWFFRTSSETTNVRILFLQEGSGSVWLDAIELRELNYNDYREGWAIGRINGLYGQGDVMGIGLGAYESGKDHLLITESGIYFKNYTTTIASWVGTTITLGQTTDEHLVLDTSALSFVDGSANTRAYMSADTFRIGRNTTNADTWTVIDSTNGIRQRVRLASVNNTLFQVAINGDITLGINQTGAAQMFWDESTGRLEFREATVDGGEIYVYIDPAKGIVCDQTTSLWYEQSGYTFVNSSSVDVGGLVSAYFSGTSLEQLRLFCHNSSNHHSSTYIDADAPTGYISRVLMRASTYSETNWGILELENNQGTVTLNLNKGTFEVNSQITVNDTYNSQVANGITIKATSGELFTLKSDISHDFTSVFQADTFLTMKEYSTAGGVTQYCISDYIVGLQAYALQETSDSTTSATSVAAIVLRAGLNDGSSGITTITNGNLLSIRNYNTTRVVIDEAGVFHSDAASAYQSSAWDEYDDIALLTGFRASIMPDGHALKERFGDFIKEARPILESTGVVTYNDGPGEDGSIFVAHQPLQWLTIDAVRQLHDRIKQLEEKLDGLVN